MRNPCDGSVGRRTSNLDDGGPRAPREVCDVDHAGPACASAKRDLSVDAQGTFTERIANGKYLYFKAAPAGAGREELCKGFLTVFVRGF